MAWSTFSTVTNPGGHGIFDFLTRDTKTYLPLMALSRYEQKNAFVLPKVVNMRRGTPFWDLLSAKDIESTILRIPCAYPPDKVKGRMLSGVGVPDLRGGFGTSALYTTRTDLHVESSEKVVNVSVKDDGISTHVIGPRDPKTKSDHKFDIHIEIQKTENKIIVTWEMGAGPLVVGFALAVIGLTMRLIFYRKEIRIFQQDGKVWLAGTSEYYQHSFTQEMDGLAEALRQHVRGDGSEEVVKP